MTAPGWASQFHPESILTPDGLQLLGNFPDNIVPAGQKEKRINRILDTLAAGQDLTADHGRRWALRTSWTAA